MRSTHRWSRGYLFCGCEKLVVALDRGRVYNSVNGKKHERLQDIGHSPDHTGLAMTDGLRRLAEEPDSCVTRR